MSMNTDLEWQPTRDGKTWRIHCGSENLTVWWTPYAGGTWLFHWTAVKGGPGTPYRLDATDVAGYEEALQHAEDIFKCWFDTITNDYMAGGREDYRQFQITDYDPRYVPPPPVADAPFCDYADDTEARA